MPWSTPFPQLNNGATIIITEVRTLEYPMLEVEPVVSEQQAVSATSGGRTTAR